VTSATEQLTTEKGSDEVSERRRGMKLVALGVPRRIPEKKKDRVRIAVSDDLFRPSGREVYRRKRDDEKSSAVQPNSETLLVGLAALSCLLIGYYLGRRRD
jgi:hypothetical protein